MRELHSCKEAILESLSSGRFSIAHLYNEEKVMDMHIHDCYEIYFSVTGGKQFLIDNKYYKIEPGDVFVINQYESHYLSQIDQMIHERIVISIHPDFLKKISTLSTNLTSCFTNRSTGFSHQIRLTKEQQHRFRNYVHKITSAQGYGSDLIENTAFIEIMILLNSLFLGRCSSHVTNSSSQYKQTVTQIIDYINQMIYEDITIQKLSEHFYLSESYICRIFKQETGTTINKYLTARRISIAKSKLVEGFSVTEVCAMCGFNDYSNFVKSFTKAVGISPKRYSKFNTN